MKNYQNVARELMVVERAAWWNPRVRRILKAAPLVVMFLLLNTHAARAACSFNPTPDSTADGSSNSLRHAIQMANASGQDCLIQLQAGTYTLTLKNTNGQDNTAAQGDLDITDSGHTVTVKGKGAGVSIVNGNGIDRVFQVLGGANAVFANLTIEGGIAQDDGTAGALPGTTIAEGGGVLAQGGGRVTLSQVSLTANQAVGGNGANGVATISLTAANGKPGEGAEGGGLFLASGTINLTSSKVSGNSATGGHGGYGSSVRCSYVPTPSGSRLSCPGFSGTGGVGGAGAGGGLYVLSGNTSVSRSTVSGNQANGASGGGGGEFFATTIDGCCRIGGNGGDAQGAGLFVGAGALSLRHTTLSGNSATGGQGGFGGLPSYVPRGAASGGSSQGAGLFVANGNIGLANNTLFANTANGGQGGFSRFTAFGQGGDAAGGGLYLASGSVSLRGVTTASNQALTTFQSSHQGSSSGGGIANAGTGLFINTTLIGDNTKGYNNCPGCPLTGSDIDGSITATHSLIGQTAGAIITDNGNNIFNVDPLLDPNGLKLNGGPTQTVALESSSPAIDKGDNAVCAAPAPNGLAKADQRGFPRFRAGDQLCDIGAIEFVDLLIYPTLELYGLVAVGQSNFHTASVTNNQTTAVTFSKIIGGADPADFIEKDNCDALPPLNSTSDLSSHMPRYRRRRGLRAFRDADWAADITRGQTMITVAVKQREVEHKVRMRDFEA